jgi:predicted nuclease of restriction endonuclease-like (RecB) superfamily
MPKRKKRTVTRAKKEKHSPPPAPLALAPATAMPADALFARVAAILEQARSNVVRAVNSNMVLAYWMIGREIVQELQGGEPRAAYGKAVLADLSKKLATRYGGGFSETTLQYFRKFYQIYADRCPQIPRPTGVESALLDAAPTISRPLGVESFSTPLATTTPASDPLSAIQRPMGAELLAPAKCYPAGSKSLTGFSPQLSWSHYRALMRVEKPTAREFYEREAITGGWDKRTLERQIHSAFYERLLKSQQPEKLRAEGRSLMAQPEPAIETLKNPYVLEFLGLPEVAALHETDLESAILSRLQVFLLELGNGFAFVARQKHLRFGAADRYVDLVFYHCRLKFYLLIDLKIGELTHGDVGQMDGYVRMFDDLGAGAGDNPTIGLILCTEKNETVAKYSVLKDRKQIFASKYMLYLPTEEELIRELQRERRLIEEAQGHGSDDSKGAPR